MKKRSMMIAALALASLARAAITIDYIASGDPAGVAARTVVHDVGADTVAIAGITAPGSSGTFGGTSTGTFDILLTAIG